MRKNAALFTIDEEIKKLENNIDWLQKKNLEHQSFLDGNNEKIEELRKYLIDFELAKDMILSTYIEKP